jgi:hypothetical protein
VAAEEVNHEVARRAAVCEGGVRRGRSDLETAPPEYSQHTAFIADSALSGRRQRCLQLLCLHSRHDDVVSVAPVQIPQSIRWPRSSPHAFALLSLPAFPLCMVICRCLLLYTAFH